MLDDFLIIDLIGDEGFRSMAIMIMVFNKLGILILEKKIKGLCEEMEYLGIILDLFKMEVCIFLEKVECLFFFIGNLKLKCLCIKWEFFSILGYFNFVVCIILVGRLFIFYLLILVYFVKKLYYYVNLMKECRNDLVMWEIFLK